MLNSAGLRPVKIKFKILLLVLIGAQLLLLICSSGTAGTGTDSDRVRRSAQGSIQLLSTMRGTIICPFVQDIA